MEFLLENYVMIISAVVAVLGAFGLAKFVKYITFAKEVVDIYANYNEYSKDGKWLEEEYTALGREVVEAVDSGKLAFKK